MRGKIRVDTPFQNEILERFGSEELLFYLELEEWLKGGYCSYYKRKQQRTPHIPPLSPAGWFERKSSLGTLESMGFESIAQKLHLSYVQVVHAYKTALQKLGVLLEERDFVRE